MTGELSFWQTPPDASPDAPLVPREVHRQLTLGQHVAGLDDLPTDRILQRIAQVFASWDRPADSHFSHPTAGRFEVQFTSQSFRVTCEAMDTDDMNRLIDIAIAYDCPLYDPQIDQRFDAE